MLLLTLGAVVVEKEEGIVDVVNATDVIVVVDVDIDVDVDVDVDVIRQSS